MQNLLRKSYLDGLLKDFFSATYQFRLFEDTFQELFDKEDPLEPGVTVEYKIKRAVHADFYELFNKFRKKYDCDYYTKDGNIVFAPIFSDVKNTYWEKKRE